jgi:hypothetical protein
MYIDEQHNTLDLIDDHLLNTLDLIEDHVLNTESKIESVEVDLTFVEDKIIVENKTNIYSK